MGPKWPENPYCHALQKRGNMQFAVLWALNGLGLGAVGGGLWWGGVVGLLERWWGVGWGGGCGGITSASYTPYTKTVSRNMSGSSEFGAKFDEASGFCRQQVLQACRSRAPSAQLPEHCRIDQTL